MNWTIKQAEEMTGLSADTLRYYEKEGIIAPRRHENGYRTYGENDIAVLKNIVVLKYAGFTIAELKNMAKPFGCELGKDCAEEVSGILRKKITELKQAISNYHKIVKLLEESLPIINAGGSLDNNEKLLDDFIDQIFRDIRNGTLFTKEE